MKVCTSELLNLSVETMNSIVEDNVLQDKSNLSLLCIAILRLTRISTMMNESAYFVSDSYMLLNYFL